MSGTEMRTRAAGESHAGERPSLIRVLIMPTIMLLIFWGLAISLWLSQHELFYLVNFGYIGTSVAVGMALYAALPRKKKHIGRKVALFLVGGYMFGVLGIIGHENMQIEGFFFYLLAGYSAAAVMHYMVAKVVGPVIFGRGWCGWACWTAMIFDLLPFVKSPGRLPGKWGWLRYLHFALSLSLVFFLWHVIGYRVDINHRSPDVYWLLVGNALYFFSGIALAYALKDNRAFCKYLCPITAILKLTTRFSLMKIRGKAELCTNCGACVRSCPMDIDIPQYIRHGRRVLSTECIQCQQCMHACPTKALSLTAGFDLGGHECLRVIK